MKLLDQYAAKMKAMNGTTDSNGMPSQGDQELNQRVMQNTMTAHHTGDGIGLDGFKEPSLEDLVDMVESGKMDKELLGEDADRIIKEVNQRRKFKLPGEFPGSVEEFDKKYDLDNEEVPDFMEIPVVPFKGNKEQAFLREFTKSMEA
tara:strand:+ start:55 stop:495 length:441 start_codon:yes stop_codon:yes gene_type:complete